MITPEEKAEYALKLFNSGFNCSQAIAVAFADETGLPPDALSRMGFSFGGGVGGLQEVCGAVTGMTLILGCLYGYSKPTTSKNRQEHYRLIQGSIGQFTDIFNSYNCNELLTIQRTGNITTDHNNVKHSCGEYVYQCSKIIQTYLNENSKQL